MKFYIVDAFAEELFGGNPAGVVILDDGVDFPDPEQMRKTAAELRYSETAFIKKIGTSHFQIRYFTPAAEVDLCGHATIGSFIALKEAGLVSSGDSCLCSTLAGKLNVIISENAVLMDMAVPEAIGEISDPSSQKELYDIMGISPDGQGEILIGEKKGQFLIPEMISTGLPDILMPVRNEEQLAAISPDFPALSKLSEKYGVVGVHAFTINTSDGTIHCRNFAPLYEIDEEAATGTSNGALTYYLYKNRLLQQGDPVSCIQGEKMGRPSVITGKLTIENGSVLVQVGGSGVILASGSINL